MSIATFSPPIKATANRDSLPRILIGIAQKQDEGGVTSWLIAVDSDGVIEQLLFGEVTVNWRYDPKTELWADSDTGATEEPFGDEDA